MANIKLNLNEFNVYLQKNKIDFSADKSNFDAIFKECNTITPDDGELRDDEMRNFLGKISGNLAKIVNKYINGNKINEIQQVLPRRNKAEQVAYKELLQEAVKIIKDNQELLGLSNEELEYIKNYKIESIEQGSARYDKGDDQLKFNINDLNKPNRGNFIKVLIHEVTHASIKSGNNTKDEERKCEIRAIQGALKLYKIGQIDNFPVMNKMLSELDNDNTLNQFIEDWLIKCGYEDYPSNNKNIGYNLINKFNKDYPSAKSSTYLASVARDLEKKGGNKTDIDRLYKEANLLEIEDDENNINCEPRARIIDKILTDIGYRERKAIVLIHGEQNLSEGYIYGAHVFNIIGLNEDAIITNLETWGDKAIIIDSWAGKVFTPEEGIAFYRDFLGYNHDEQSIFFEELNSNN